MKRVEEFEKNAKALEKYLKEKSGLYDIDNYFSSKEVPIPKLDDNSRRSTIGMNQRFSILQVKSARDEIKKEKTMMTRDFDKLDSIEKQSNDSDFADFDSLVDGGVKEMNVMRSNINRMKPLSKNQRKMMSNMLEGGNNEQYEDEDSIDS